MSNVFAVEDSLIKECITNSRLLSSYHSKMYIRDLTDERIARKDINTIDWIIDYVSPDKFSVEQYANIDKLADKWITIGNTTFRYFNFWVEMPLKDELAAGTTKFNKSLSLDKYIEILADNNPKNKSEKDNSVVLSYSLKEWKNYNKTKIWELKKDYNCELKIWINKRDKLIEKAFFKISSTGKKDAKVNFEIGQEFSNYNSKITIERPEAMNFNKDKAKIIETIGKLKEERINK